MEQAVAGGHLSNFEFIENGLKIVKKTKQAELDFYQEVFSPESDPLVQELQAFVPQYYGTLEGSRVIIQNLMYGFKNPCVIDLKLGAQTFSPDASEKKRKSHESKRNKTTSGTLGYRVSGMCIRNAQGEITSKWNRGDQGGYFDITPENIHLSNSQCRI